MLNKRFLSFLGNDSADVQNSLAELPLHGQNVVAVLGGEAKQLQKTEAESLPRPGDINDNPHGDLFVQLRRVLEPCAELCACLYKTSAMGGEDQDNAGLSGRRPSVLRPDGVRAKAGALLLGALRDANGAYSSLYSRGGP